MDLLILGCGDAFTRRHFGCSALIAPNGFQRTASANVQPCIMIDCPDPIHRVLAEATDPHNLNITVLDIDDIIVTHLHGDHSNGLESFGFFRRIARQRGTSNTIPRLHVSPPVAARIWSKLAPAMDAPQLGLKEPSRLEDFFDVKIIEPGKPASIASCTVECRYTKHPVPTTGMVIQSPAPGNPPRTLGWSSDTPFEREHVDFLARADLIIHECNVGPAHTPLESLESLPNHLRAKMRLMHTPDDFDPRSTTMPIVREGDLITI